MKVRYIDFGLLDDPMLIGGGLGAVIGGFAGNSMSAGANRKSAEAEAAAAGLTPGTMEYLNYVNLRAKGGSTGTIIGALVGALGGAAAGSFLAPKTVSLGSTTSSRSTSSSIGSSLDSASL